MTTPPHAIPYQGSKRRLAGVIVPLIPPDTAILHEPFCGSAAVTIAARHLGAVKEARISDINEPLMALWDRLLVDPEGLADGYERLWREQLPDPRCYYEQVRQRFNRGRDPVCLLYLLARCVKAAVRYNADGEFNQAADNRRLGAAPARMRQRVLATSAALAGTEALTRDYRQVLDEAGPDDVVYMDPPYEGVSFVRDHRYVRGLGRDEFEASLERAVGRDVSFIVSYDGATGGRAYGRPLGQEIGLTRLEVNAGRSTQATLNGQSHDTVESLYLSPALVKRLNGFRTGPRAARSW